jgi:hypothetical protein
MTERERLPNRRRCSIRNFKHGGMAFTICGGFHEDGRLGEIFLASDRPGSAVKALARDAAVVTSLALQFGCPVEVIRHALTKDADGGPATLLGTALSALAIVDLEAP